MLKSLSLVLMAVLYIIAGILHFIRPRIYLKMMPPYLPAPGLLVKLSGIAEIFLGVLLFFPELRPYAAWGIVALLIAIFPANIYMFQKGGAFFRLPNWVLLVRLPLQLVLIAWAWIYTEH